MQRIASITLVLLLIGAGIWYLALRTPAPEKVVDASRLVGSASYLCDAGKTIDAFFYESTSTPAVSPDMPPTPGGSVKLALSDGRALTLPQTISGSGVRYANADESMVFWSKGNGSFITENATDTYSGCIAFAKDPGGLGKVYENGMLGYSIRYPESYVVNDHHVYQGSGPGNTIAGVKFTIASTTAAGTNLSADTYLSVEEIPNVQNCSASLFVQSHPRSISFTDNGRTYSVATSSDAGAGNRYNETVYAIPGTNPCIGIRYFVHSTAFENYPAGAVVRFDEPALLNEFDKIRRTLTIQ